MRYFEAKILHKGGLAGIGIGLASVGYTAKNFQQFSGDSVLFMCDEGRVHGSREAASAVSTISAINPITTPIKEGDVIGCGCDMAKREVFFTLNGALMGVGYGGLELKELHATVVLYDPDQPQVTGVCARERAFVYVFEQIMCRCRCFP